MNKTPFFNYIKNLGARMIAFGDWEMPVSFSSIKDEHNAVRSNVGLFDISHMGFISITGDDSEKFLDFIATNNIKKMKDNDALYSPMCNEHAGIIDDIIIYKKNQVDFFLIVNASNIIKDYGFLIQNSTDKYNVQISNLSDQMAGLAIQGPNSKALIEKLIGEKFNIGYYTFEECSYKDYNFLISRTGYSGEIGYELWINNKQSFNLIEILWDFFINQEKITPCGLAARDVLRLEAGYALYGNELNENINPIQASLKWTVDLTKDDFIGKNELLKISNESLEKKLIGIEMIDNGIPRHNYKLFSNNEQEIGFITSGTHSFTLNKNIALAYIDPKHKNDPEIYVEIRGKKLKAAPVKKRFYYNEHINT